MNLEKYRAGADVYEVGFANQMDADEIVVSATVTIERGLLYAWVTATVEFITDPLGISTDGKYVQIPMLPAGTNEQNAGEYRIVTDALTSKGRHVIGEVPLVVLR